MENASKALLMAGGVLLTMLIVVLIIFARGSFEKFYNSQDELKDIKDVSQFNVQFTNYNRKKVYGYEIISLANKVADYNKRHSNASEATNDEKYNPITMKVSLDGKADKFRFSVTVGKDDNGNDKITSSKRNNSYFYAYNTGWIEQSTIKNELMRIINDATGIADYYGDDKIATKLAKSINSLILSKQQLDHNAEIGVKEEDAKKLAVENYNKIKGTNDNITYDSMVTELTRDGSNIMKYYEFYQFKRAIFYCDSIEYDSVSSRVSKIQFIFTGKIE